MVIVDRFFLVYSLRIITSSGGRPSRGILYICEQMSFDLAGNIRQVDTEAAKVPLGPQGDANVCVPIWRCVCVVITFFSPCVCVETV